MSKKKGMSIEEKVEKIEGWFVRHPCPYTLKELLSLIPKATGVIYQSIEECMELLVSEGRVQQEKVGVSTLFWRFPLTEAQKSAPPPHSSSSAGAAASSKDGAGGLRARLLAMPLDALAESLRQGAARLEAGVALRASFVDAIGSDAGVAADQQRLAELNVAHKELIREKAMLAASDPEVLARLAQSAAVALEAANRWTDNYFLLEESVVARMGESPASLRRSLQVPAQLDFIDALPPPPARPSPHHRRQQPPAPHPTGAPHPACDTETEETAPSSSQHRVTITSSLSAAAAAHPDDGDDDDDDDAPVAAARCEGKKEMNEGPVAPVVGIAAPEAPVTSKEAEAPAQPRKKKEGQKRPGKSKAQAKDKQKEKGEEVSADTAGTLDEDLTAILGSAIHTTTAKVASPKASADTAEEHKERSSVDVAKPAPRPKPKNKGGKRARSSSSPELISKTDKEKDAAVKDATDDGTPAAAAAAVVIAAKDDGNKKKATASPPRKHRGRPKTEVMKQA